MSAPAEGTAAEILASVVAVFDAYLSGRSPGDDVTLVCIKIG